MPPWFHIWDVHVCLIARGELVRNGTEPRAGDNFIFILYLRPYINVRSGVLQILIALYKCQGLSGALYKLYYGFCPAY